MDNTTRPTGRPRTKPSQGKFAKAQFAQGTSSRWRRAGFLCALYVIPVLLLGVMAFAVGYVRLRHGPVSLQIFVAPIERGISAGLGGMAVNIEDALLMLGENGGVEFRLSNLSLAEGDGDLVATAPLAAIELSPGSFWSMSVEPARVFLIEPKVSLSYTQQSGIKVTFDKPAAGPAVAEPQAPVAAQPAADAATKSINLDLAQILAKGVSSARSGEIVTSNLREIGVRNALVSLDYEGVRSDWRVAEATLDLEHRKRRSIISGAAKVVSEGGPWSLSFRAEDSDSTGAVVLQTSVRDFVPSSIAKAVPALGILAAVDLPVAADTSFNFNRQGVIQSANAALALGAGQFNLGTLGQGGSSIDAGLLNFSYSADKRLIVLQPSTIRSGESFMTLGGAAVSNPASGLDGVWTFDVRSTDGRLAAEEFGVASFPASFAASGTVNPTSGAIQLAGLSLKAADSEIALSGEATPGPAGTASRFEGKIGPMPLDVLKALWPRSAAPGARTWVGKQMTHGRLQSGSLVYASGQTAPSANGPAGSADNRLSVALELVDLKSSPGADTFAFEAPRALARLEGDSIEVNVPDATIKAGESEAISLKNGRFTAVALGRNAQAGEAVFRVQSPLTSVIAALSQPPLSLIKPGDVPAGGLDGKVDGLFTVKVPLGEEQTGIPPAIEGKAKITDIKSKQKIGSLDLQGGTVNLDIAQGAVDVKGELLLNGVLAKTFWRKSIDGSIGQDQPLKILATLDNADRNQVGLDVNHIVQGDMGLEITVAAGENEQPAVHVKADLTSAELFFEDLAWTKAPGGKAVLDLDVKKGATHPLELHNIKLAGNNIAIEGWAAIDNQNDLSEFFFPEFSLNVVSRLEVQGKLGRDKIWKIKANGSTFDGKDLLTALVSLGGPADRGIKPLRPSAGMDLDANIANVLGHNETSLRGFKLKMSQRSQKLTAIDVSSTIDGGKPLAALLKRSPEGKRIVYVDSTDAGQVFKLANFYPNMQGGRVRLEVNLDGKGAAARTGILWVEKFKVLGDPVVSEVLASAEGKAVSSGKKVVREVYDFDILRAPFQAGHEQLVLEDSQVRGPVVGATIAGKVDYRSRKVNLGGTYIPLQGINSALCAIPLVGMIITGPKCDGVVGITYAIQGPMAQPQVIVNPLSMFTPGILKEIMQMTNPNQKVNVRDSGQPKTPASERVGTSASEAVRAGAAAPSSSAGRAASQGVDGWSSGDQATPGQN